MTNGIIDSWLSDRLNPPSERTIVKLMRDDGKDNYAILKDGKYYIFSLYSGHWDGTPVDYNEKERLYSKIDMNKSHLYMHFAIANSKKMEVLEDGN